MTELTRLLPPLTSPLPTAADGDVTSDHTPPLAATALGDAAATENLPTILLAHAE